MAFVPSLLTIREVCELLGVSRRTVSRWVERGLMQRAGQLTVETRGSLVLVEILDKDLEARLAQAALDHLNTGKPVRFLADRLALAALSERLEARAAGEEATTPATELTRLMTGFDDLIEHLGTVRATRTDQVAELQQVADRLRSDATFATRTNELEDILHAVQEVRRREGALLLAARQPRPDAPDRIVELEEDNSTPFDYSEHDDAIDAAYLATTPEELAKEEATVSEIMGWVALDPTVDLPPGTEEEEAGTRPRSKLSELAARLDRLCRLHEQQAAELGAIARELRAVEAAVIGAEASPEA